MHASGRARCSLSLLLCLLTLPALLGFQDSAVIPSLSKAELEKHIRFLASDELEGRKTGTDGDHVAARYIAEHFRAHGLSPAPGLTDFFQPVPLERVQQPERQQLRIFGTEMQPGDDFILLQGESLQVEGELKDVGDGFGVAAEGQVPDLHGKIAITRFAGLDASLFESFREKTELLRKRGAEAIVALYDGAGWEALKGFLRKPRLSLVREDEKRIPFLLVRDREGAMHSTLETPGTHTARISLSERKAEQVVSANVIAVLRGHDPVLKEEWMALTAHFDHVGAGQDLPGATPEDSIFNGARDNGMGVTALLAAVGALSANPPARSVVFIGFTAEEAGLLGSAYYVQHPPVPLDKTVFVLNNDGAGYTDTSIVTVLGLDRTTAKTEIERACREAGLEAFAGGADLQMFFNASDNLSFAQKGVPAPTFSPGIRNFGEEIRKYYHRPADEADENFDFAYLHRFCQAYALAAELIANRPERPTWSPGDKFEKVAAELYGRQ